MPEALAEEGNRLAWRTRDVTSKLRASSSRRLRSMVLLMASRGRMLQVGNKGSMEGRLQSQDNKRQKVRRR